MRFSIIIPVYNTADYLEKCLDSVVNQKKMKNKLEVVIVNDGSTDKSEKIIKQYVKKYPAIIKYIAKENGGVSSARNIGVKESSGEYLFFLDSDDYLDLEFFWKVEKVIKEKKYDVIRINARDVKGTGELIQEIIIEETSDEVELIKNIMKKRALEVPWGYVYNAKFYKDNNFTYAPQVHEDFGLIPIILYKAQSIGQLSYIGYNYVEREGSLTAEKKYEKLKKRVDDMFILYQNHMQVIKGDSAKGKLLRSYSLEAMLSKLTTLNNEDMNKKLQEYNKYLNTWDIYSYNKNKLIKKFFLLINKKLYLNLYKKYKG